MVLKTAIEFDMSKLIDPTIEIWSSVDDPKRSAKTTIDYWFTSKSFADPRSHLVNHFENAEEPMIFDFEYSPVVITRDFWRLQENSIYTGLRDSALLMCRDFIRNQSGVSSTGLSDEDLIVCADFWKMTQYYFWNGLSDKVVSSFREFWQVQESQLSRGIDDTRLAFSKEFWQVQEFQLSRGIEDTRLAFNKEFWQVQESQLSRGIDNTRLTLTREFWQAQESQLSKGIDNTHLAFHREFWKAQESQLSLGLDDTRLIFTREFWKAQECESSKGIDDTSLAWLRSFWKLNASQVSKGLSDDVVLGCRKFLKTQSAVRQTGLPNEILTAFMDFWRGLDRNTENRGINDEALQFAEEFWEKEMVLDEINNCFKLCNSGNIATSGAGNPIIASLQGLRLDMITTLQKKEVNFELISNSRKVEHLNEVDNLQKTIESLFGKIEEISQKVDQGWSSNKSTIANETEIHQCQLISKNAELTFENHELMSNFIRNQEELVASNAKLHRIVSTMEKNTEKYLKENCQMQNIIRKLGRRLVGTTTNCSSYSTRSKGPRRGNSFSKKRHVGPNSIVPPSLDMIYVDS